MRNLIKAQNYQLKRDKATRYILIGLLGSLVVIFLEYSRNNLLSELTGGDTAFTMGEPNCILLGLLVTLLTCRIVGWDYTDKTINYELMAGHSRAAVFWSRVCVSLVWTIVGSAIFLFLPLLVFGGINGWGSNTNMGEILLRYGLSFLPLFRLLGECVLLTMLLRNCYMAMVIGYVLYEFGWVFLIMLDPLIDVKFTTQISAMNVYRLLYMGNSEPKLIDGGKAWVYDTALESGLIIGTICVSLMVGVACLGLGYLYFRKSDMN